MINSNQLNNKLKSTLIISLWTKEVSAHDQSFNNKFNDEKFLEMIRKIVKEEIEKHEEKIGEIIKIQLENTTDRLDGISQEVVSITKSLEFTQEQLDEELAKLKNDVGKNQTDINDIGHDLLDSQYVMEKLIELEDRSCDGNLREESPRYCREQIRNYCRNWI